MSWRSSQLKQYMLSVYQPDGPIPPADVLGKITENLEVLNRDLKAAGAWVFAVGLHPPSTATVVKVQAGETLITDGPFTESKEHIGGFTIIRAPDLDAALEWASRLARATTLPIEVRPLRDEEGG
jgi:hypothetical protein